MTDLCSYSLDLDNIDKPIKFSFLFFEVLQQQWQNIKQLVN